MSDHAKLSPSASDRWLNCTVAPSREAGVPDKTSPNAAEGTAAHALAEWALKKQIKPTLCEPEKKWAEYDSPTFRAQVDEYYDYVVSQYDDPCELFVEQRLNIFPQYEVFGTADAVIVQAGVLKIIDLKFGTGVLVEAEENTQLKMYAWGGLQSMDWLSPEPIQRIEVTIVQPRRNHIATKKFDADELRQWAKDVEPVVRKAYAGSGVASPGSHCRWCRVRATCPERAAMALEVAGMDFSADCKPMEIDGLSEEQLVNIFLKLPLLEEYIKAVETHVADLAHDHKVAGLKWVSGRSSRVISNPVAAALQLRKVGIEPWEQPKLLGITALDKLCKANKLKLDEVLGDSISVRHAAPVLVSEADPREEFQPTKQAAEDFS